MSCEYCMRIGGKHDFRCPNYESPTSSIICSVCDEYICDGEEYIVNEDGEYRHCDCYSNIKELVEWLGYKIETMELD